MGKKTEASRKNAEPVKGKNKGEQKEDQTEKKSKIDKSVSDSADNEGFSTWLRSNEGIDMMRLFVIANSFLIFVTVAWPNMQQAIEVIKSYIFADPEEDD